jgi:cyanate permease
MITVFSASISTMLQLQVPRELRGRVMSLYTITLVGVASLGTLASAAVAAASSAPKAYLGGAVLFAVIAVLAGDWLWDVRTVVRSRASPQPVTRPVGS